VLGDTGDIGCWALGLAVVDVAGAGLLFVSFNGTLLALILGLYVAVSVVGWAFFWRYRDEFR
jgi:hypothetical protein